LKGDCLLSSICKFEVAFGSIFSGKTGGIMQSLTARRALLNCFGIFILLAGLGLGTFIYCRSLQAGSGNDGDDPNPSEYDSRVYQRGVQMYVGTFGLIMDEWSRAAGKLREPRPLAITIIVFSTVAAGGCLVAASRISRDRALDSTLLI
jgi:hypothetical protein